MLADLFHSFSLRYSRVHNRTLKRLTMLFPGAGCEWRKKTGGCSMCGFYEANKKITFGLLWPALFFEVIFFLGAKKLRQADEVCVYNGGSFLNDNEIPLAFQRSFCKKIANISNIKEVFIESRCEYLDQKKLEKIKKFLGRKELVVGIGLESYNDNIRNNAIRKGLDIKLFKEKIKLLNSLGITPLVYILLKPLRSTEDEAYSDVLSTIAHSLADGVKRVTLSSSFVQPKTFLEEAWRRGEFKPPKLWTVLKIIKEAEKNNWPLSVGGFSDWPPPLAIPANCPNCSGQIYAAIEKYRQTGILGKIPDCSCSRE